MRYPTNRKPLGLLEEYPAGTQFRTANGMVVEKVSDSRCDMEAKIGWDLNILSGPGSDAAYGTWFNDGSKAYEECWAPNSHIIEAI